MPITKEIEISYGLTINTGNYSAERIDLAARVTLVEGYEEDQVINDYLDYLKGKCQEIKALALDRVHG